ncbi:hypothetical protein QBC43DRAFT_142287 [Cladorrhinum sp. PSN259]|nr:hypothetical protein QBC43DRAFT_142287 [Cladorrhinum sp. PSN259]
MEISSTVFSQVLSPLAIFSAATDTPPTFEPTPENQYQAGKKSVEWEWEKSPLNPKNRIDSLEPLPNPTWRLDGADTDGRRFFAVPAFALDKPPTRIDVYVPPFEEYPRTLRDVLRPEEVLWSSKGRIPDLPIGRYLIRVLHHWSEPSSSIRRPGLSNFEKQYHAMPFGSKILVTKVSASLEETEIHLYPEYEVEQAMLTVEALQKMWGFHDEEGHGGASSAWPPVIELSEVKLKKQLHEAITLVDVRGSLLVFKSLLRDQRYMYNELKMLLTLKPHPNLVPRPKYVVVKKGRFGGKRGVCGFLMEYFPLGSLKERLLSYSRKMALEEKFRLARQVTEALIHVNAHENGFYPDLKPDNIVLRESQQEPGRVDAVLLDLEQRGGWFSWSPPEIAYVEYLEIVAAHAPNCGEPSLQKKKEKALSLLREYIPDWKATGQQTRYHNSEGGFSAPWLALLRGRQENGSQALERAQVFMLGKLLWCIFEGEARVRCGIDHEVLQENNTGQIRAFPGFELSPKGIRELIKKCTAGGPEWERPMVERAEEGIALKGGKLYPAGVEAGGAGGEHTALAAKRFWMQETENAERFVEEILGHRPDGGRLALSMSRPLLAEVLSELWRIEESSWA